MACSLSSSFENEHSRLKGFTLEGYKVENYIATTRITDLLRVAGPYMNVPVGQGFDRTLFAEGMRYEASLASAISGALAIAGENLLCIPAGEDPENSLQATLQRLAFWAPDGGHDCLAQTFRAGSFVSDDIEALFTGPPSIWAEKAVALMKSVGMDDAELSRSYWWRAEVNVDFFDGAIARSGRAAHLYRTCEEFGCPINLETHTGKPMLDLVSSVESALGQIGCLRAHLRAQHDALTSMVRDRQLQLVATYTAVYDGVPESDADRLHEIIRGRNIAGDRDHVRSMIQSWMA